MAPDLSVVIPTHERPEQLRRALESLDSQRDPPTFEVLVVANQGDDLGQVEESVARRRVQPRTLVAGTPGVSAARNRGWREATAPLILFIGDDILPGPSLVREHFAWHRANTGEEVGVLGHIRWARDLDVTPFMRWLEMGLQFRFGQIAGIDAGPGHFVASNVSLKRKLLQRVDGFDEDFRWGLEDIELAYRLSLHGFRLLYNRRAEAEHLHQITLEGYRARMRIIGAAERKLVEKHPEMEPMIYERMSEALARRAQGRAARFVRVVPPWVPMLGPIVWTSAGQGWLEALAPAFLEGWEEAGAGAREASIAG